MSQVFILSVAAALGANARYWIGDILARRLGTSFPFGTLVINLSGSLLLGLFLALFTDRFLLDPRWRMVFTVGFLGSYTTFSTYTFESVNLMLTGQWGLGLLNLLGSSILGAIAALLGVWLGKVV